MGANASHHEPLGDYHHRGHNARGVGGAPVPHGPTHHRTSFRKSLRKKKKDKYQNKENTDEHAPGGGREIQPPKVEGLNGGSRERRMDRLRRSFRESFRSKKKHDITEASKPHQWQTDEASVRAGTCSFPVKYLGCVEVYESRGMQVCEEALKVLRNSRRRPLRGILYVSGDGLRVVDDETKGLLVDQTIEKVSFCAPDRNHEKGFSYICRDGTTRRWMCHGFVAVKETGERLSHAVGCAFAACLERKQKRDKECGVTMSFDPTTSTFTRTGSFRQMTVTERLSDPQECKPIEPVPIKKVENPHAIARPHATPLMLQRQGSFRVFQQLGQSSPFKRQLSLRLNELPSNLERTRSMSLDNNAVAATNNTNNNNFPPPESPQPPPRSQRNRLHSLPNAVNMTPIPESSPVVENKSGDAVSAMCKELSDGLTLLSSNFVDPFTSVSGTTSPTQNSFASTIPTSYTNVASTEFTMGPPVSQGVLLPTVEPIREENPWAGSTVVNGQTSSIGGKVETLAEKKSRGEEWLSQINTHSTITNGTSTPPLGPQEGIITTTTSLTTHRNPPLSQLRSSSLGTPTNIPVNNARDPMSMSWTNSNGTNVSSGPTSLNSIGMSGLGSLNSMGITNNGPTSQISKTGTRPASSTGTGNDPFDAEWAALAARNANPNNPFLPNTVTKAFEVQM